jgi:hypothetical protein
MIFIRRLTLLILILFLSFAFAETKRSSANNKDYMTYVMKEYIPWVQNLTNLKLKLTDPELDNYLQEVIAQLDNWHSPDLLFFPQIMIGVHLNKEKTDTSFQFYIHKEKRKNPLLKKLGIKNEPSFISWSREQGICFISKIQQNESKWDRIPRIKNGQYFRHDCQTGVQFQLKEISILSGQKVRAKKDIFFEDTTEQLQIFNKMGLARTISYNKKISTLFFPKCYLISHILYSTLI